MPYIYQVLNGDLNGWDDGCWRFWGFKDEEHLAGKRRTEYLLGGEKICGSVRK